jgi:hypothetical protein
MKVEWKDSDFSVEKWKLNENIEMKTEFCKTKKRNSFGGSGNKNRATISGGTDAETEFPFPTNMEFSFYDRSA